jgi:sugar phosphate isomerase/epimerase
LESHSPTSFPTLQPTLTGGDLLHPTFSLSRRRFLGQTALLAASAGLASNTRLRAHESRSWSLGVQSYSFRRFSTADALRRLKELGLSQMEFYPGHFLPVASGTDADATLALLRSQEVAIPAFGVLPFGSDEAKSRSFFEFAQRFGVGILSADPDPEAFPSLERLCEEFGVRIAIHNHGPEHRYSSLEDLQRAVDGRSPHIGVCLDTGHALRSGLKPHEMLRALGARVHSVHLKDWITGGDEQVLGEGDLDLPALVAVLRDLAFAGPLALEYELQPEDPVPDMRRGLANWRRAVG